MRRVVLHEPTTIFTALAIGTAGLQIAEGFGAGQLASSQGEAEAEFLEAQRIQNQKQLDRDKFDLQREQSRRRARTRAVLAAQGGDTASGTGLAILKTQEAVSGRQRARLEDDARVADVTLGARADEARRVGGIKQAQNIFGGITRAAGTASTLFSPSPRLRSR